MLAIKEEGVSLFSKTRLEASKLLWYNVTMIKSISKSDVNRNFPDAFAGGIGTFKNPSRNFATSVSLRSRTVPFSLKKATDIELQWLTKEGVLKLVDYSEWAGPVVIVPKSNGNVLMCCDFRRQLMLGLRR